MSDAADDRIAADGPQDGGVVAGGARADRGGWRSTSAQGLMLARWVAAEVAAQRVLGLAWVAWLLGLVALAAVALSLPVDPGWPLVGLGVVLLVVAIGFRLVLAVLAAVLRRLALPRRARHLRADAAAARVRLRQELAASGVPVSLGHAAAFVWALARGRRPHARVVGDLRGLSTRLVAAAEVAHLRARLAEAVTPAPAPDGGPEGGPAAQGDR
ncbi:MAG: hypothetical protein ACR2JF_07240 [Iamia sp.]